MKARLWGSKKSVELFERLIVALLDGRGMTPMETRDGSGEFNNRHPSDLGTDRTGSLFGVKGLQSEAFIRRLQFTPLLWIKTGYDDRDWKAVGQLTVPFEELQAFVENLEAQIAREKKDKVSK